ncbi:Mitochondrial distribution and morphology protein 10 [Naganishia albida]|nr:Mitochondrial distribution and morphology protein 10 [Naganishia albida]
MLSFSTLLLRAYYNRIGWNEDNFYANLNRSSSAILDFTVPPTLSLQISKSPTDVFYTSYALDALPRLNGGVSYVASEAVGEILPSRTVPLRTMVDHFRVPPSPRRPCSPPEEFLAGELVVPARDYLLYSRLHFPSLHLSALATTKIGPGSQASLAFMHSPGMGSAVMSSSASASASTGTGEASGSSSTASGSSSKPSPPPPPPPPPPGNVILSFQQDTGRWTTEYTYSATDGMLGFRGLYNFGLTEASLTEEPCPLVAVQPLIGPNADAADKQTRVDEEEAMEGGLRGRFSAGGEIYFSRKQRSLGVSTGLRFTTVPSGAHAHHPASPPTTLTLLYNPLMGFLSTAYSAQISPHLALSSRYGVNVYSYESDLCVGGEWWIGGSGKGGWRGLRGPAAAVAVASEEADDGQVVGPERELSTSSLATTKGRESRSFMQAMRSHTEPTTETDRDGVLKAKISGNGLISLLYESRIRKCLVSVGVVSDLSSRSNPVRTIGMEVQYFSD